jgi:dolichol-phosphate mannosyltransferase
MRTLVVIPTFLEAENVTDVLRRVRAAAPEVDVLVVDDNSADGTADLARAAGDELGQIDVLVRPDKGGLGVAYRAGFQRGFDGDYDVLVQMDADLSHDPAALPQLLGKLDGGADVAIGSRYVAGGNIPHWPFARRALSRIGNLYASTVLGLKVHDATSGYRAYRAALLRQVEADATRATGYGFQVELAYRAHRLGAEIVEVPITFNDRVRGESKMSWHIIGEAMSLVTWWGLRDRLVPARRRRRAQADSQSLHRDGATPSPVTATGSISATASALPAAPSPADPVDSVDSAPPADEPSPTAVSASDQSPDA